MADDIKVDVGLGSNEIDAALKRTFDLMVQGAEKAERVRQILENTGARARELPGHIQKLNAEMEAATKSGLGDEVTRINGQLTAARANQREFNDQLRTEIQLLKEAAVARGAAERRSANNVLADGRTVNQARAAEGSLRDAITGINTTSDQLTARLTQAMGKAMERMLTSTSRAMEDSLAAADMRVQARSATMAVPGIMQANVVGARVSAERKVAQAATGSTLAEQDAYRQEEANKTYLTRIRRTSLDRIERDRVSAEKTAADQEIANVNYLNRLRRTSLAAVEKDRVKDEKEAASLVEANTSYLAGLRRRSLAAAEKDRVAQLDPNNALREVMRDESFKKSTGFDRTTFLNSAADRGLTRDQQASELRAARATISAQKAAEKTGPAAKMSYEDRAAAGFQQQDARFSLNGGADQFAFQAKLAANYAIFGAITGAITGSVGAIKEFDDTLIRFQAITGAANSEMTGFRKQLLGVAADSRFSVNELAQVAITLGQTGLSASDVAKAIKPVSDLAAASGSTLQQSVEAVTGVLGSYGMAASRSAEVSDILVGALNRTKLTMEQLQLGIQYAANIARDSGVSFSELTATIGAISQAGVRSGSTIGTGVRQLITELSSPTEKLRGVLKELGINLADVDLRANGLSGVLKNLQAAGFTTADALRALDLRAAAAFSAIGGQGDLIEKLRQEMLLSSAAAEGAGKANESLTATMQRLQNVLFGVVDSAFSPLTTALKASTDALATMVGGLNQLGPILPAIGTGLAAIVGTLALLKVGALAIGLLTAGLAGPAALGIGAAAGVGYLAVRLVDLSDGLGKITKRLDELKGVENELASKRDAVVTTTTDIDRQIDGLIARRDKLNSDPLQLQNAIIEAQKGFGDLGFSMEGVSKSADGLIEAYQRLRTVMNGKLPDIGLQEILTTQEKIVALQERQRQTGAVNRQLRVIIGPEGAEFDSDDDLEKYRKLGPAFSRGMQAVSDPNSLNVKDPLGNSSAIAREMVDAQTKIFTARQAEVLGGNDPEKIKAFDAQLDLAREALARFGTVAGMATQLQAEQSRLERQFTDERINRMRASPELGGFLKDAEGLQTERSGDQAAVLGAKGLDGKTRIDQLMATLKVSSDKAKNSLSNLQDYRDSLVADAVSGGQDPKEAAVEVDAALSQIKGKLDQISKNATTELRQLIDSLKPEAVLVNQSEKRANDATISALTKEAQNTNNSDTQEALSVKIKDLVLRNATLTKEILTFGKSDDDLGSNAALKDQVDNLDAETNARLEKLAEDAGQRRKRIEESVLRLNSNVDKAREADLRAQAAKLEKIAKDVQTTPDKARELVEQINKLLDEAKVIATRRIDTDIQREKMDAPAGPIADSRSAPAGSVAATIIEQTRAAGKGNLVNYMLGAGQLESGMGQNLNNDSGAKGLYQFMPKTWPGYGKGDIYDTTNQVNAMLKFTQDNIDSFQKSMGRAPSDAEMFQMHNQGAAGALKMFKNPDARAADLVPQQNIESNLPSGMRGTGASGTITAGEYTKVLAGMYETAARASEKLTTSADKILTDKGNAQKSKVEEEDAGERRRAGSIVKDKEDQALLAGLKLSDKTNQAEITTALAGLSKANEPATISKAVQAASAAYGRLNTNAMTEDDVAKKTASRTPKQIADDREQITDRYREMAQKEVEQAADAAGKLANKQADEEIARMTARLKAYNTDKNENKEDQAVIDALNQQLTIAKEKRGLEGESASIQAQIATIQEGIAANEKAGLGTADQQVKLQEKLLELKKKLGLTDEQVGLKKSLDATGPSYGNAISGASTDFMKSRGIMGADGTLVDDTVQMRKLLTAELSVIGGAFDNLWTNLANGSMKAGDALKKFATDILGGLMTNLSKSITNDLFKAILGGGGGGSGGGIMGFLTSLIGGGSGGGTESFVGEGLMSTPIAYANGGKIPYRMAAGGRSPAPNRDGVPITGMPGEYMLRRSAAEAIGYDKLDEVNALGGQMINRSPKMDAAQKFGGAKAESSVYIVDRDQVPPPTENDIVHMLGSNIQRGGALKQLIKQTAAGG